MTATGTGIVDTGSKVFPAAGALGQGVLVKTPGALAAAGLAEQPIGVMKHATFAAGPGTVDLLSKQGTLLCKAAGAFSAGAIVYGRASGLVDDVATSSAVAIGVALDAATAANDLVEVMPL
ncbi:MAG TPA: capsid cement protein [Phycisphaerae bacterium]|nr:capsid cement protein [Phycisphaerae bacterium]